MNEPRKYDAVLGTGTTPFNAAVLGGIQGVKRKLQSINPSITIEGLMDALRYPEEKVSLITPVLENPHGILQLTAYSLLERQKAKTKELKEKLKKFVLKEDLSHGITLELIPIRAGNFLMGSPENKSHADEKPQHLVKIHEFFMGKYPVTQAQWKAVANFPKVNIALQSDPSTFKGDDRPVENVNWHEANEFCDRLSQKSGLPYRLPSEAEWEYACRATSTTAYAFGDGLPTSRANCGQSTSTNEGTTSVGSYPPNTFGLYDMHGNVWEWCADDYHSDYQGAPNDGTIWLGNDSRNYKVVRGGSWGVNPVICRSAYRNCNDADNSSSRLGFRVVCAAVGVCQANKQRAEYANITY